MSEKMTQLELQWTVAEKYVETDLPYEMYQFADDICVEHAYPIQEDGSQEVLIFVRKIIPPEDVEAIMEDLT